MSVNILSAIMQFLTPDLIGKIATACGLDRAVAQKAAGAAVPAILGGLANLVSRPEGAHELAAAVARQPRVPIDSLADAAADPRAFADTGASLLSTLLGGNAVGTLASALGRLQGMGEGSARTLIGMLAPVVLGVLGREQRSSGLDTGGLARMLTTQKEQFSAAMPAQLASMLGASGIFGREAQPGEAFMPGMASLQPVVQATRRDTSSWSWAYWALPLLALAGLVWYLVRANEPRPQLAEAPQTSVAEATRAAQTLVVGGTDVGRQVVSAIEDLGASLQKVKDAGSATATLPALQTTASELDRLATLASRLPADARGTLANFIKASAPKLNSALAAAMALPGVPAIVKPTIDELRSKLDTMAMASGTFTKERPAMAIGGEK